MSHNASWLMLLESVQMLSEAKTPAEQAHDLGLHHVGYGYWADDSGNVVARTVDGHLVKLSNAPNNGVQGSGEDLTAQEIDTIAKKSMNTLALHALEHMGKADSDQELDAESDGLLIGIKNDINTTIMYGVVPNDSIIYGVLDEDELESYKEYLQGIANSKNNKLVKAIAIQQKYQKHLDAKSFESSNKITKDQLDVFFKEIEDVILQLPPKHVQDFRNACINLLSDLKKAWTANPNEDVAYKWFSLSDCKDLLGPLGLFNINNAKALRLASTKVITSGAKAKEEPELSTSPADAPSVPEPAQTPSGIDINKAAQIIGIDQTAVSPMEWEVFTKLIEKVDQASTKSQLNHIQQLFKKSGILGPAEEWKAGTPTWNKWKALFKFINQSKEIKPGTLKANGIAPNDELQVTPPQPEQTEAEKDALAQKIYSMPKPLHDAVVMVMVNAFNKFKIVHPSPLTQMALMDITADYFEGNIGAVELYDALSNLNQKEKFINNSYPFGDFIIVNKPANTDPWSVIEDSESKDATKAILNWSIPEGLWNQMLVEDKTKLIKLADALLKAPMNPKDANLKYVIQGCGLPLEIAENIADALVNAWGRTHAAESEPDQQPEEEPQEPEQPTQPTINPAPQLGTKDFGSLSSSFMNKFNKWTGSPTAPVAAPSQPTTTTFTPNTSTAFASSSVSIPLTQPTAQSSTAQPAPAEQYKSLLNQYNNGVLSSFNPETQEKSTNLFKTAIQSLGIMSMLDYTHSEQIAIVGVIASILEGDADISEIDKLKNASILTPYEADALKKVIQDDDNMSSSSADLFANLDSVEQKKEYDTTSPEIQSKVKSIIKSVYGAYTFGHLFGGEEFNKGPYDLRLAIARVLQGQLSADELQDYMQYVHYSPDLINKTLQAVGEIQNTPDAAPANNDAAMDMLKNTPIHPSTSKLIDTCLTKHKMTPETTLAWAKKKMSEQPSPKWQWAAMELVKQHGVPLDQVPASLIPDNIASLMAKPSATPSAPAVSAPAPAPEPTVTPEEPKKVTPESVIYNSELAAHFDSFAPLLQAKIKMAVEKAIEHNNGAYIEVLKTSTPLSQKTIASLFDQVMKQNGAQMAQTSTNPDTEIPLSSIPEPATPASTEPPAESTKKEKVTVADADNYLTKKIKEIGLEYDKFSANQQKLLDQATAKAFNANTEIGVFMAFKKVEQAGFLPDYALSELKFDIAQQLQEQGNLYTGEDAFKKTFDYSDFLQQLENQEIEAPNVSGEDRAAFASWLKTLSDDQQLHLIKVMEQGMNMATSAQATELYNKELSGLPGWNETTSAVWRRSLRHLHDEFMNAHKLELKKKQEAEAKKQAEMALKKAWDQISSGNLQDAVEGILVAAGVNKLNPTQQTTVKGAVAKALSAKNSQEAFDWIESLTGGSYGSQFHSGGYVPVPNANLLKDLVTNMFFDLKHKDQKAKKETSPVVNPKEQAKAVFKTWLKSHGMTPAHLPSGGNMERQNLVSAVTKALGAQTSAQADQAITTLAHHTSLQDDQIASLRQIIHQEREKPSTISPENPQFHKAGPSTQPVIGTFGNHPEIKSKLNYYKIPEHQKQAVADIMKQYASQHITTSTREYVNKHMRIDLQAIGVPAEVAKNIANWTTLQALKGKSPTDSPSAHSIVQAAKQSTVPQNQAMSGDAVAKVAALSDHQDIHKFARQVLVPGETIKVHHLGSYGSTPWNNKESGDSDNCHSEAVKQHKWRVENIKKTNPQLYSKFTHAADAWQGSGQWYHSAQQRKATNTAMHEIIDGPPPMYTKVDKFVERGMDVKAEDFKELIKAFEVGKRVYLGPSGFSANHSTPTSGAGQAGSGVDQGSVKVLLRVYPGANGMIRAARLTDRPEYHYHQGEQELVLGTNNYTRVKNVTKHVMMIGQQACVSYEIEMDWDESLNESMEQTEMKEGFSPEYWKGLSPQTVKAMIKYMNTPVAGRSR